MEDEGAADTAKAAACALLVVVMLLGSTVAPVRPVTPAVCSAVVRAAALVESASLLVTSEAAAGDGVATAYCTVRLEASSRRPAAGVSAKEVMETFAMGTARLAAVPVTNAVCSAVVKLAAETPASATEADTVRTAATTAGVTVSICGLR